MGKYTFIYEGEVFDGPQKTVTLELGEDNLDRDTVLAELQGFLVATGFFFGEREILDVRDYDSDSDWRENYDTEMFWQARGQEWENNGWENENDDGQASFEFEQGLNGVKGSDFSAPTPQGSNGDYMRSFQTKSTGINLDEKELGLFKTKKE